MKGVDPSYANHVRDLYGDGSGYDLERLFNAGDAVQHATSQPGWSVLLDLLSVERESIRSKLEGAIALEHHESAHLLGQLRGLGAVEAAALAITQRARAELEDQQRRHEQTAGESAAA